MEDKKAIIGEVYAQSRNEWRLWLEANHHIISQIWLVLYKKGSSMPSINYKIR